MKIFVKLAGSASCRFFYLTKVVMLTWIILVAFGTLLLEISSSWYKLKHHDQDPHLLAPLFFFIWLGAISALFGFFTGKTYFNISLASISLITLVAVATLFFNHFAWLATKKADRSTAMVIWTLTLPWLIVTDSIFYHNLHIIQVIGILLLVAEVFYLFRSKVLNSLGAKESLIAALIAIISLTGFKYHINYWSDVYAFLVVESIILTILTLIYLIFYYQGIKNLLNTLYQRKFYLAIGLLRGLGEVPISLAYNLWAASVITTFKRWFGLIWAALFGKAVFAEQNFWQKLIAITIIFGLILVISYPQQLLDILQIVSFDFTHK